MSESNGHHDGAVNVVVAGPVTTVGAAKTGLAALGTTRTASVNGEWEAWLERPYEGLPLVICGGDSEAEAILNLWFEHKGRAESRTKRLRREADIRDAETRRESESRAAAKADGGTR